jgi:GTP-binding protein HflX
VTQHQPDPAPGAEPERGFVVAVLAPAADGEAELAELHELLRTAGVEPVGELLQHRPAPDPRTYVGKGKLDELKHALAQTNAESLVVDDDLDPGQQRRLENELALRVVDRTQLILDIFAQHAVTAEGKLQVELAQLEYNLPRMRGLWQHLERLGGGIGTRGPGESQLETDRRLARRRISLLKRRLRELERRRATQRKSRRRSETPVVALAGYTNAGKSTLLNALTDADVSVNDRLFETLDPTTRSFSHEGRAYLVTDTVGFIRRLPHQLVEGFAATLEETLSADLVLHVADSSATDSRLEDEIAAVEAVLHELGADKLPVELVLNKIDAVDPLRRRRLRNRFPDAVQLSALKGKGLDELRAHISQRFAERLREVRLLVPYDDGRALSDLYELGTPIEERIDTPAGVVLVAHLPRRDVVRFAAYLVEDESVLPVRARRR